MKPPAAGLIHRVAAAGLPALLSRAVGTAGVLCLLGGFVLPWFVLPSRAPLAAAAAGRLIEGTETPATVFWKIGLAGLAGGCAWAAWKTPARRRPIVCRGLALGAALLLFYPCALLYLAPTRIARANWLGLQHSGLVWPGGDIFGSVESRNQEGRIHVKIVDIPRQVGAVKIPQSIPYLLDAGRLGEAIEWLGYSDAYCLFAGRGWLLALSGTALLLASVARPGAHGDFRAVRLALRNFAAATGALCVLGLLPVVLTAAATQHAQAAMAAGDDRAAQRWLRRAGTLLPIIRENSYFVVQMGLLDDKLRQDTLAAALFRAIRLEENGYGAQAEAGFTAVLAQARPDSALEQEALRGLLRQAIRSLNTDANDHALALLQAIVRRDPVNLKANSCLQYACLRTQQLAELQDTLTSMRQIYRFMGTITKIPMLAFCQDNEATVCFLQGNLERALAVRRQNP